MLMLTANHFCDDYERFFMQISRQRTHLIGHFNIKPNLSLMFGERMKDEIQNDLTRVIMYLCSGYSTQILVLSVIIHPIHNSMLRTSEKETREQPSTAKIAVLNENQYF